MYIYRVRSDLANTTFVQYPLIHKVEKGTLQLQEQRVQDNKWHWDEIVATAAPLLLVFLIILLYPRFVFVTLALFYANSSLRSNELAIICFIECNQTSLRVLLPRTWSRAACKVLFLFFLALFGILRFTFRSADSAVKDVGQFFTEKRLSFCTFLNSLKSCAQIF